ncbi:unnamed protein product, partial [Mesorhabditis belari]|uniref:Peptidase A1 domain-containing protein n=1 Tax=Mesorhabditis belari TaxID=2138241 RepID=A0AAF3FIE4_9BILA
MEFSANLLIFLALFGFVDALLRVPITRHKANRSRLLTATAGGWNEGLINENQIYYQGNVIVGTPGQTISIDFDTGSDLLWMSCNCARGSTLGGGHGTNYCNSHTHKFAPGASSTNQLTTNAYSVSYGSGYLPGTAHCSASNQKMMCASFTDSSFQNSAGNPDSDGLMGLAYGQGNMANSAMKSIVAACTDKSFAFYMTNTGAGSELTICGKDPAHYVAPLHWLNIYQTSYYWTVALKQVVFGGAVKWSTVGAIILDTGTTGIYLPGTLVSKIQAACNLNACSCPTLTFNLNGVAFNLEGKYYLDSSCNLMVYASSENSAFAGYGANWILGDAFMRKFYTVYDYVNAQVAIAPSR